MLKANILEKIKKDKKVKAKLQFVLDKAAPTIQRYLDNNNIMLTTVPAMDVIKKSYKLTEADILENETIKA